MSYEKILDDMNEIVAKMRFKEEIDYAINSLESFIEEES